MKSVINKLKYTRDALSLDIRRYEQDIGEYTERLEQLKNDLVMYRNDRLDIEHAIALLEAEDKDY